jgi:hypothetical protein
MTNHRTSKCELTLSFFVAALLCGAGPSWAGGVSADLYGIYFDDHGANSVGEFGDHPLLTGVFIRSDWAVVNPGLGVFDFQDTEDQIAAWALHGKKVYVGISPMVTSSHSKTPEWIYDHGVVPIDYLEHGEPVRMPKMWDETTGGIDADYLEHYTSMMDRFALQFANDPRVSAVMCPIGALGYMAFGSSGDLRRAAYAHGWTAELYVNVMRSLVTVCKQKFPNKVVIVHPTALLVREPDQVGGHLPNYTDVIRQMSLDFSADGITLFGSGVDQDVLKWQSTGLPEIMQLRAPLVLQDNHQHGLGDDWPFFNPTATDSHHRDEADFEQIMVNAIGDGSADRPFTKISFMKFLDNELRATMPGAEYNEDVYDSTVWMLGQLVHHPVLTGTSTLQFTSVADSNVVQNSPDQNNGGAAQILLDGGGNIRQGYLKFVVTDVTGVVTGAKLKLYCTDGGTDTTSHRVPDASWGESTLTWNNRPTLGASLSTVTNPVPNTWYEFPVPGQVSGAGTYSFGLETTGADIVKWASKEAAAGTRPVLEVTFQTHPVNHPPMFASDPFSKSKATQGQPYSGSIAGNASDSDPGDTMTFSKLSGPAWLTVAGNGTLSGTPPVRGSGGVNTFTVRVTDSAGAFDDAVMNITVVSAP